MRYLRRLWRWLRSPAVDYVSDAWLNNERGKGIDQSTTSWPWEER